MSEKDIWDELKSGKIEALEAIYEEYFDPLYSYALKLTFSESKSQDAIHDLFVDLWKYSTKLSDTTSIKFYLFRALRRKINRNQIVVDRIDLASYKKESTTSEESFESEVILGELKKEQSISLSKSLEKLSDRQKEAIHLKFYDELSYPEIAEIMEVNEQSARNLVNRGLEYLRKIMLAVVWLISSINL